MKYSNTFYGRVKRTFALTILAPILVLLLIFSWLLYTSDEKHLKVTFDDQTEMIATHIDGLVDNMDFIALDMMSRPDYLDDMKRFYYQTNNIAENYSNMADNLIFYKYFQNEYDVTYLDERGYCWSTAYPIGDFNDVHIVSKKEITNSSWYNKITKANGAMEIVNTNTELKEADGNTEWQTFALGRAVTVPSKIIGYILVQVDLKKNSDFFSSLYDMGAVWAIYSSDGSLLCYSSQYPVIELNPKNTTDIENNIIDNSGRKYVVSVSKTDNYDLYVVGLYPTTIIWKNIGTQIVSSVLFAVLIIAVVLAIVNWYSYKPLRQLAEMMKHTTLDNLKRPPALRADNASSEIERLYNSYQIMSQRLNDMVQEKLELTEKMAEQRYKYLQYQINPHFIYNTLNVIGIMGEESGQRSIFESCKMLASLLRYSLTDFMKPATFCEEFSSIQAYLNLMKMRLEHKITYVVKKDTAMDQYLIPRFSIQPFLENVFEHAFDENHTEITVSITGIINDGKWAITIQDNGKGFDQDKMNEIRAKIDEIFMEIQDNVPILQPEDGIGVINTLTRLRCFFGDGFEYNIYSENNEGSRIVLSGDLKVQEK